MTVARDIAQLCFSSNLTGIMDNEIEQSFYSVYSRIESIEDALIFTNKYLPVKNNLLLYLIKQLFYSTF